MKHIIFEALLISTHNHLNGRTCYPINFDFDDIKCTKYWTLIDLNPFASIISYLSHAIEPHEQTVVLGGNRVHRVSGCVDLHTKFEKLVLHYCKINENYVTS